MFFLFFIEWNHKFLLNEIKFIKYFENCLNFNNELERLWYTFIEIDYKKVELNFDTKTSTKFSCRVFLHICVDRMEKFSRCTSSFVVERRSLIWCSFPPRVCFASLTFILWRSHSHITSASHIYVFCIRDV